MKDNSVETFSGRRIGDIIEHKLEDRTHRSIELHFNNDYMVVSQYMNLQTGKLLRPGISWDAHREAHWLDSIQFSNALNMAIGIARSWEEDTGKEWEYEQSD